MGPVGVVVGVAAGAVAGRVAVGRGRGARDDGIRWISSCVGSIARCRASQDQAVRYWYPVIADGTRMIRSRPASSTLITASAVDRIRVSPPASGM